MAKFTIDNNILLVLFGIYGLRQLQQKQQAGFRSISYLGLIGVGVCSAGYHMTLKYHTQMCMFRELTTSVLPKG
jgi:dihydroceramidase